MSAKISLSEYYKESAAKCRSSMNKENAFTAVQSGKSSEGGKKRGLSLNAENRAVRTTSVQSFSVGKAKFPIYFDGDNENVRSRPRVRKDVCRKEIRARGRDDKAHERTIVSKVAEIDGPASRLVSRRTRSSSNCRQSKAPLEHKVIEMNNKLLCNRRAYSESRKISPQYAHRVVQSSDSQKIKHLTDDVKKRTFSSIQMWKDKMRKPHTGTVTKNIAANVLNGDKRHAKTKLPKSSVIGAVNLQSEMSQSRTTNPSGNVKESKIDPLTNVYRFLSNEIVMIPGDKSRLKVEPDTNTRNIISETTQNNNLNTTTATPLDGPSSLPLTPTKVRYEKRAMNTSVKQENEPDIICMYSYNETMYVCDYLEDIPDTERKKEDNAPKLSSRFLRENVNAEQRRLVVGYIIRLGVHYRYSCNVIYQTVKLFNVAIDRILVETNDIQLIALACLWITLKREAPGHKIPSATAILQLAKDLYINQEKCLLMYERKILSAVKFNTRFADPFSLLSYYILNVNRDSRCNIVRPHEIPRVYFCGSYMIDVSMLDEGLCDVPAYVIAIAAVELSFHFVYSNSVNVDQVWCQVWRSKQSLTEWEERMLNSTKRLMMQRAVEHEKFGPNVIYKKYMRSRHGKVTNFLHSKLNAVVI